MMPGTVLVTGSAGVVGRRITHRLKGLGYTPVGLDINGDAQEIGNILDIERVTDLVAQCDGIIHCAAISRVAECQKNPTLAYSVNVEGTRNLVSAITRSRHRPWLIFCSSREVYGNPISIPVSDDHPLQPQNVYGLTKLLGEQMVTEAFGHKGRYAILRLTNVFGCPNDISERVIPSFVSSALAHLPITITGPERLFDFVHIDDVVEAVVGLMPFVEKKSLQAMLVSSGFGLTLRQLYAQIQAQTGTTSPVRFIESKAYEVQNFIGKGERLQALSGWKIQQDFDVGLSEYIQKIRKQQLNRSAK